MASLFHTSIIVLALSLTLGPYSPSGCSRMGTPALEAPTSLPAAVSPELPTVLAAPEAPSEPQGPTALPALCRFRPGAQGLPLLPLPPQAPAQAGERVELKPTPVRDTLSVHLSGFLSYRLVLMNAQGRTLERRSGSEPLVRFMLANQPPGKYYLRVYGDAESFAESFEFRIQR